MGEIELVKLGFMKGSLFSLVLFGFAKYAVSDPIPKSNWVDLISQSFIYLFIYLCIYLFSP